MCMDKQIFDGILLSLERKVFENFSKNFVGHLITLLFVLFTHDFVDNSGHSEPLNLPISKQSHRIIVVLIIDQKKCYLMGYKV